MTILKRYKCIKSNNETRFAVGEIYPLYADNINYIVDNSNMKWSEKEFPTIKREWGVELEEENEMNASEIKEGQTLDLNKLTTAQLKEYCWLLENKEKSERLLNEFIERVSK